MCSQISDTLDHSPTYPGRRSKRLTKKKVRTTGSLCASLLGVFIISLVNSTDPQEWSDKLHGLDQSTPDQSRDEIDGSLGWKSSSSESLSLLSVAYPVSEIDTLPISTSSDLPENDRHISPSDPTQDQQRWTAQYTNRSLESQSTSPLLSTPLILIQDPSDSRPVQALDQLDLTYDGSDQTSSPDSVSRKDSSPLRLFFPSDPSPSSIPLNSVNLDRPRESHSKRWLGARQVLVTTSYPGTDTGQSLASKLPDPQHDLVWYPDQISSWSVIVLFTLCLSRKSLLPKPSLWMPVHPSQLQWMARQ